MKRAGRALRLTIFVDDDAIWHHKSVSSEIVHRAHRAGLAGAAMFHGIEGFGAKGQVHVPRTFALSSSLPMMIVIIDSEPRIREFLPQLDELTGIGLVTVDPVEAIRHNESAEERMQ